MFHMLMQWIPYSVLLLFEYAVHHYRIFSSTTGEESVRERENTVCVRK